MWATDTSRYAVAVARANVRQYGLADRIVVCHADLLDAIPGPIDLVVANLPYLPAAEAARFPDLAAEPDEAVFAGGNGLEPYAAHAALRAPACAHELAASAPRATGAQRNEKCGLIASARRNHRCAEASPRQRSIMARWK